MADSSRSEDKEAKQCRICLSGPEDEQISGRLIKPCMCKGSMQYVHVKCLNKWRMSSGSQSAFYSCDTCHYSYAFARTRVVGLATSPVVLGTVSLLFFSAIVFLASFLIVYFVPSLATPSYSLEAKSFWQVLMTPVSVANRIIHMATRTYDTFNYSWWWGYADEGWEPLPDNTPPTADKLPHEVGILTRLVHRFILGLSAVGSLSFVSWIWQMSLFGPFRFGLFRGNNRNRRDNAGSFATILVLVFILIGVARTMRNLYIFNRSVAQRLLASLEDVILEVG
ncbi:hypothetical protein JB92DRAFT_2860307 [Gautieria morchelliformis]|nr:hypothetical protein JB92DRAFT_2860307 [Gautieria morchelliformis]